MPGAETRDRRRDRRRQTGEGDRQGARDERAGDDSGEEALDLERTEYRVQRAETRLDTHTVTQQRHAQAATNTKKATRKKPPRGTAWTWRGKRQPQRRREKREREEEEEEERRRGGGEENRERETREGETRRRRRRGREERGKKKTKASPMGVEPMTSRFFRLRRAKITQVKVRKS